MSFKKCSVYLVLILVFVFSLTLAVSLSAAKPPCNTCKKDGCPDGYCYVDCVGCCFMHPLYGLTCFR